MTPNAWQRLIWELNGNRIPDGEPGIRDVDAPCDVFEPGEPGSGTCETDGHYICAECVHISMATLRTRRDQCHECGAPLVVDRMGCVTGMCSAHCDATVSS